MDLAGFLGVTLVNGGADRVFDGLMGFPGVYGGLMGFMGFSGGFKW